MAEQLKVMASRLARLVPMAQRQAFVPCSPSHGDGRPAGFILSFFFSTKSPPWLPCPKAMALGSLPDYIRKLVTCYEAEKQQVKTARLRLPPPPRAILEPLSQASLEFLRLVAAGTLQSGDSATAFFWPWVPVKGAHTEKSLAKLGVPAAHRSDRTSPCNWVYS